MGCGCAPNRNYLIPESSEEFTFYTYQEREFYMKRKREQVVKFFQLCEVSKEQEKDLKSLIELISMDCQGFSMTQTGGEATTIKKFIESFLDSHFPPKTIINASIEFIKEVVSHFQIISFLERKSRGI